MSITIGKHRLSVNGDGYQITRVRKSKKDGNEYESDYAYYATCEAAVRAIIERMIGDHVAAGLVEDAKGLIVAIQEAQDTAVKSVTARRDALFA